LPRAKKQIERLSGDQKERCPSSVPVSGCAVVPLSGLTNKTEDVVPVESAANTSNFLFGESAGAPPEEISCVLGGGRIVDRITCGGSLRSSMTCQVAAAAAIINAGVRNHHKRSRVFRRDRIGAAIPACDPLARIHFSSSATSRALCHRSPASFSR